MEQFALSYSKSRKNFPYKERPWYLMSIYTDDDVFLTEKNKESMFKLGCRASISLSFWDVTKEQVKSFKSKELRDDAVLFDDTMAETVIGFIMSCDQDDETDCVLIVHCDAGISRSGACGTFAVDFLHLDYNEFVRENHFLRPNPEVLNLLRRKAGMTPKFE